MLSKEEIHVMLETVVEMVSEMMARNNANLLKGVITTLLNLETLKPEQRVEYLNKLKEEIEKEEKKLETEENKEEIKND